MSRAKQIIYPLQYFRSSLRRDGASEESFEAKLASYLSCNVRVKAIGRARAGLYLLAKDTVSGKRNKVILSPYTIPDVINMIRFAGGEPVFVDALPNSTNVDLDHLSELIDERTCCVIVTHYHFNQSRMKEIRDLLASKDILLFDDCALALGGSTFEGRIGSCTDGSVFSFSGFKALNFFWGGAVSTRSAELANRVSAEVEKWPRLRLVQYSEQIAKIVKYDLMTRNVVFSTLTFPLLRWRALRRQGELLPMVRVDTKELDATILSRPSSQAIREWDRKLGLVDQFIHHRRAIAAIYNRVLHDRLISRETAAEVREGSCLVNYPICVDPELRTDIYKKIIASGFDVGLSLYPNVHEMQGFDKIAGRSQNVSRLVRSVITLPTHFRISEEYAARLADVVKDALCSA